MISTQMEAPRTALAQRRAERRELAGHESRSHRAGRIMVMALKVLLLGVFALALFLVAIWLNVISF